MTTQLLPQAFWFRLALRCPRVDEIPRPGTKGRLLDLPVACRLPDVGGLEGKPTWADVRLGWNPAGLAIAVETTGMARVVSFDERPEDADGLQFWIDTRDTRDVARATRFCHRFTARLRDGSTRQSLAVRIAQRPIPRAVADAPQGRLEQIASRAERTKSGWRLELFLPGETLHGFDPETNRRLGFAYQVSDPDREDQFLTVGRDFPIGENPSLWSTLELVDG